MSRNLVIRYIVATLVFIIGVSFFFSYKSYPAPSTPETIVSNAYVLRDAVPQQVYSYTISKISQWSHVNKPTVTSYLIDGDIGTDNDGYNFSLSTGEEDETLVQISVKNYGNFFSIQVSIDGKLQSI